MIVTVASGKGGTGKTTVAVSLAQAISHCQFLDCDVEEPNSHIFIRPNIENRERVSVPVPEVDLNKCNFCHACSDFCEFNALSVIEEQVLVFQELCHNCGGCSIVCPLNAISYIDKEIGSVIEGTAGAIRFYSGELNISEPSSIPIIKVLKSKINDGENIIIDSPPGTSCSMIESVSNSDFCLLVTEPTPFGLNDLSMTVDVLEEIGLEYGVVINRSGIGNDSVLEFCREKGVEVMMEIPFSRDIAVAYSKGESIIQAFPEYRSKFSNLWERIQKEVKSKI